PRRLGAGVPVRGLRAAGPVLAAGAGGRRVRLRVRRGFPEGHGRAVARRARGGARAVRGGGESRPQPGGSPPRAPAALRPLAGRAEPGRGGDDLRPGGAGPRGASRRIGAMEERKDHLWKVAQEVEERIDEMEKAGAAPAGIDVGTSKVVAARRRAKGIESASQLNAFIPVPYSRFTETILGQNEISYFREGSELVIFGSATEKFANMFNADVRRPMADGMVNPKEKMALPVLEA